MPLFPGMERVTAEQRAAGAQGAATQIAAESHAQLLDYEKGYMRGAGGVLDPDLADQLAQLEARSDPPSVAEWLREDLSSDLRPDLAKISVPLLEIAPYNEPDLINSPTKYTPDQKASTTARCSSARRRCKSSRSRRHATSRCSTSPSSSSRSSTRLLRRTVSGSAAPPERKPAA